MAICHITATGGRRPIGADHNVAPTEPTDEIVVSQHASFQLGMPLELGRSDGNFLDGAR